MSRKDETSVFDAGVGSKPTKKTGSAKALEEARLALEKRMEEQKTETPKTKPEVVEVKTPVQLKATESATQTLDELPKVEVKELTNEEKKEIEKEQAERERYAINTGEALDKIRREIAEIESDPKKLALSPTLQKRLFNLRSNMTEIQAIKDVGIKAHVELAAFLEECRHAVAEPEHLGELLEKAQKMGRIREVSEEKAKGRAHIFYTGKYGLWELVPDATGKISEGNRAVETELRGVLDAQKKMREERKKDIKEMIKELKEKAEKASPGMTLLRALGETPKEKHIIFCDVPADREKRLPARTFLVLWDEKLRAFRPHEGLPGTESARFFAELDKLGVYASVESLKKGRPGKVFDQYLEKSEFDRALPKARAFFYLIDAALYEEEQREEEKKRKAEKKARKLAGKAATPDTVKEETKEVPREDLLAPKNS